MKIFYNYFVTGGAAIFFFFLALIDLLIREDKNDPNAWAKSWEYMSLFGKIDVIIMGLLFVWTIGVILIRNYYLSKK